MEVFLFSNPDGLIVLNIKVYIKTKVYIMTELNSIDFYVVKISSD